MQKHIITESEYEEVNKILKSNTNKRVDKKLQVIKMRYEGKKDIEIAEKLDYSRKRVSQLCGEFKKVGASEYARHKYAGNHRNMRIEEEQEILDTFRTRAALAGKDIKAVFDERLGRDTRKGYIYMLLKRHNWRMIMPRGKHPKKASESSISDSKKLRKPIKI